MDILLLARIDPLHPPSCPWPPPQKPAGIIVLFALHGDFSCDPYEREILPAFYLFASGHLFVLASFLLRFVPLPFAFSFFRGQRM